MKWTALLLPLITLGTVPASNIPEPAVLPGVVLIDATGAQPGRYVFIVDVDDVGDIQVQQVVNLVKVGAGPAPPQPDPPEPDPGGGDNGNPSSTLAQIVSRGVSQLPGPAKESIPSLQKLYRQVATWLREEQIPTAERGRLMLKASRVIFLDQGGTASAWKTVFDQVDQRIASIDSTDDLAAACDVIAEALGK